MKRVKLATIRYETATPTEDGRHCTEECDNFSDWVTHITCDLFGGRLRMTKTKGPVRHKLCIEAERRAKGQ